MKEQLIKSMQRNQIVSMMYMAKDGKVSKRSIKIIKIIGDSFQAYCFSRKAKRTFGLFVLVCSFNYPQLYLCTSSKINNIKIC